MIEFCFESEFDLAKQDRLKQWISDIIEAEGFDVGEITYVFCSDEYLQKLNIEFLNHDTLTDIISFDYCLGNQINGEIFISIERVAENASDFKVDFNSELHRVMIHGILHYCGYNDKTEEEESEMRRLEDRALLQLDI